LLKLVDDAQKSWRRLDGHNQLYRGCQARHSSRCRLTPLVTKIQR
jgi:hypothetical protein